MDPRKRKLITMHKTLHLGDDVNRLYVSRKEGVRALANVEDSVDASIQGLEEYTKKSKEKFIIAAKNSTDSIMIYM